MSRRIFIYKYYLIFIALAASSCVPHRAAIKYKYNFNAITSVGVAEFTPAMNDPASGKLLQEEFLRYFLRRGINVKLVDLESSSIEKILEKARKENITAVVVGIVAQYAPDKKYFLYLGDTSKTQQGQQQITLNQPIFTEIPGSNIYSWGRAFGIPGESHVLLTNASVSVAVKMIDVETGDIVWMDSCTYEGLNIQAAVDGAVNYLLKSLSRVWPSVK
jgi:hypothetical protein